MTAMYPKALACEFRNIKVASTVYIFLEKSLSLQNKERDNINKRRGWGFAPAPFNN
jgi:hypothetical protein